MFFKDGDLFYEVAKQSKLVFQKNKASVYFHIFQKKFVSLFENWGVMCYIDVKLVFLSATYEICK